ncbi:hypothetical protein [Fusobacterium polymorphum]|jgi:hypothetical protein|uniref:hypothetical protein n=1 Tax=Fusobacterium nucleatum subsp. polymorphum TaxID=76857 RepID=UPI0030CF082C
MEELKSLSLGEIKNKITSTQDLYLVSVNYDNENGIKLEKNIKLSDLDIILGKFKNYYKLYIFNEEFMLTVFNFGDDTYKYNKVIILDFDKNEKGEIKEKIKYIYMKQYGRLKVRIGKIDEREIIQYISFEKEGK